MSKHQDLLKKDESTDEIMELNLGPQHPSTHGVLRLKLRMDGEVITACEPVIGYLHTGVEKECETRTYLQMFTLISRLDYLSGPSEEHAFAQTVEQLMGLEVPERAKIIRVILLELSRIASHVLWLGTSALELNMSSVFMYCFAEREKILDIFENYSGARMFPNSWRIGGLNRDLNAGFEDEVHAFLKAFPRAWKDFDNLLTENYVWRERLEGVGIIDLPLCKQYMCTGPILRAAGMAYDVRKAYPYSGYEQYLFDIPTCTEGDSYARYLVRMQEMKESASIIEQALRLLAPGPVIVDNRKVALPPRKELARSMEAVIHHFKLVSEGIHPPEGELYTAVESARGELGYFLASDGSNRP
ncbi:MAG: NADH-quinone oxidoreductase subunit D, partial [Verrucomicrobia bacterium]|nr:NADH-quinone oxidoreductase subunit D [Verrucomicrobiota bacterium]